MIPLKLRIAGFLSYREPVELDFTGFDLACISGHNGAGKSSLLDAITWAIFGQARKRDDSLVNLQSKTAEVALTFEYEGNVYRIQRTLPRGKTTILEFQVLEKEQETEGGRRKVEGGTWRALTEKTRSETEARIRQTLRLDYETFVNASFFLQGKADEFTQKKASERKTVLGSILGLEMWETYRERAAERRKAIEREVSEIDGRIAEIDAELAEEEPRRARLAELDAQLKSLSSIRATQEAALESIKRMSASLAEQRRLADTLSTALARSQNTLSGLQARLAAKTADATAFTDLVNHADQVESAYQAWQSARAEVARLDGIAAQFREHDDQRQPLLREIEAEKARLEQELASLSEQSSIISNQSVGIVELQGKIEAAQASLAEITSKLTTRKTIEAQLQAERERQAELRAENEALKIQMDEMKARIDRLEETDGADCPLCGQPLTPDHRLQTIEQLKQDGKGSGDRYRANLAEIKELVEKIKADETRITSLASAEREQLAASNAVSQLTERLETLERQQKEWARTGAKRLKEVAKILESGKYAVDAHKALNQLDKELARLGYDPSAHEAARLAESAQREAESQLLSLEKAKSALQPIEDEIANLRSEIGNRESEIGLQRADFERAASALATAETQSPSLDVAEREYFRLREQENQARDEMVAARQKVDVLTSQRARKADLTCQREELQQNIVRHKTLERAFGKDGVPALLIEQALPQIEERANDLLDRLSDGQMSIRFVTQAEYKDKKRDDLKETLDIQISDGAGLRDYEMYSGGEAFRVNFAIRLALSEVLAQRKGARLQTLVIDEGFGSQDAQGRQRLIEAINTVRPDFAKILVITHLDELKDAFPTRIEIEKMDGGSKVYVR
jgi:exonuclease SbcC